MAWIRDRGHGVLCMGRGARNEARYATVSAALPALPAGDGAGYCASGDGRWVLHTSGGERPSIHHHDMTGDDVRTSISRKFSGGP